PRPPPIQPSSLSLHEALPISPPTPRACSSSTSAPTRSAPGSIEPGSWRGGLRRASYRARIRIVRRSDRRNENLHDEPDPGEGGNERCSLSHNRKRPVADP